MVSRGSPARQKMHRSRHMAMPKTHDPDMPTHRGEPSATCRQRHRGARPYAAIGWVRLAYGRLVGGGWKPARVAVGGCEATRVVQGSGSRDRRQQENQRIARPVGHQVTLPRSGTSSRRPGGARRLDPPGKTYAHGEIIIFLWENQRPTRPRVTWRGPAGSHAFT